MKDLMLDDTGDLAMDGDFSVGDATNQNQLLLLSTAPGEWKESPTTGVGLEQFLDDDEPDELFREIREQLKADGQVIKLLKAMPDGTIGLDATYQ